MPELVYESVPAFNREAIEEALERNDPDELLIIVLSAALHGDDPSFIESVCVLLAEHPHFNVRGNAILGFAHLARIHGNLNEKVVKPLISNCFQDEHEYVRQHAADARDDIEHLLGWRFDS